MHRAKVLATLGPASDSEAIIRRLIEAGANAFRLNFSHGSADDHRVRLERIRRISAEMGVPVAIVQDLPGPKLRTGTFPGGSVTLSEGDIVTLTNKDVQGSAHVIPITYPYLAEDILPGSTILLDDGRLELTALGPEGSDLRCRVVDGGVLSDRKGVNFPNVNLRVPSLTEKDRADMLLGLQWGVDYIAQSFVRRADDVRAARQWMMEHGREVPLISKIEKPQALDDLEDIVEASDGVMVARGDLGVELPPEQVPVLQKQIVRLANSRDRLVIIATQMLESMIHDPRPTRAEASDVANAVLDGTDVVMLSGETAVGEYPVETVEMMVRIIVAVEQGRRLLGPFVSAEVHHEAPTYAHAISHAAREIAQDMELKALVAFSQTGYTGRLVAKDRPDVPILVATPDETVWRQMALFWGVTPVLCPFVEDTDGMIRLVEQQLVMQHFLSPGDLVVILGGMPVAARGQTNFLKIHVIRSVEKNGH